MLDDVRALTDDMVRDDARERVSADQRDKAIALAVAQYGRDRPRVVVADIAAPADGLIAIPAGAASLAGIEHPVGYRPPALLPPTAYQLYTTPDGPSVMLVATITAGEPVRVTWHHPHILTVVEDTIPAVDHEAVASYAVAVLFDQIAALTSGDGNPTIPADAVNHQAKPENYAKRAERLRQRYYDLLGIDVRRVRPASVLVQLPLPSSTGETRLTHHRQRRRW